jgi:hypothetical protein
MTKRIFFILAAAALGFAGLYFQSVNAKEAAARETKVVNQDLAATDTTAAIADLTDYVKLHMGTSVEFTLKGSYDRAMAAAKASVAPDNSSQVYADAQRACSGKSDSIVQARCNQAYISAHLVTTPAPSPLPEPVLANYQHKITAPTWTPDLPGALLLGALIALLFGLAGLFRRRHR